MQNKTKQSGHSQIESELLFKNAPCIAFSGCLPHGGNSKSGKIPWRRTCGEGSMGKTVTLMSLCAVIGARPHRYSPGLNSHGGFCPQSIRSRVVAGWFVQKLSQYDGEFSCCSQATQVRGKTRGCVSAGQEKSKKYSRNNPSHL